MTESSKARADVEALAGRLADQSVEVRGSSVTALIVAAEAGQNIGAAVPALGSALDDTDMGVRKEAIWALYCAARAGVDLGGALAPLEACLEDENHSVRGNAAIGVARHYLNAGRSDDANTLLEREPFGAAWAFADHCCRTGDKEPLKAIARTIQGGLLPRCQGIRRGIATAINNASGQEPDGSLAIQAIQEVLHENPDDPIWYSKISGIFMALHQLRRRS
jgi:hypothetical protein